MSTVAANESASNPAGKAAWILLLIAWVCFLVPVPGLGILGWVLNFVAFILAIVAMAKNGATKGLWQLLASLILSPVLYFIGLAIFAGAMSALSTQNQAAQSSASQQNSANDAASSAVAMDAFPVTASQLHDDYESNEVSADAKYKGKRLLISGTIQDIQSDFMDKPLVHLNAGEFSWVQLTGFPKDVAGGLRKGQGITAACIGAGEFASFPSAKDCKLKVE